jgi:hypothetical protein
MDDSNGLA